PRAIFLHPARVLQVRDPRQMAERIVGRVDWQNEVSGFCTCPGEALHTSQNGKKDCRVSVDGAPTIFCFHASCIGVVAEANRRLRRELGSSAWELRLPDGQVLRSGDLLGRDGAVVPCGENGKWQIADGKSAFADATARQERVVIETLRVCAERFRPE